LPKKAIKKLKASGADPNAFNFYRRMYVLPQHPPQTAECLQFHTAAGDGLVVFFSGSLNNFFGNGFAVLNNEDAKHTENEHNRAVDEQ